MKDLIIGSTAIKHYYPDFPREPKDIDVAVLEKQKRDGETEYLQNPIILKYQKDGYLKPELMTSLKVSHLLWDINWEKHMFDLQFLLYKGHSWDLNIVRELREYWHEVLPKVRRSKLEQSKEEFFTNNVNMDTNEHDYLHTLIAEIPAYTKILKDNCEVELDENKWNALSFEEKCDVVFEEAAVMQIERYRGINCRIAYKRQLKDCIIKHYPSYVAFFAIENYPLLERYNVELLKKFSNEVCLQNIR